MILNLKKISKLIFWITPSVFFLFLSGCSLFQPQVVYTGSFHANDSGESHGGFEWAAGYSVALEIRGTRGQLIISFEIGLGDYLKKYTYSVSHFVEANGHLNFRINGRDVRLVHVEKDTIWNGKFNNHYIGNNSTKAEEKKGYLPAEIFSGFKPHYYVELRIQPSVEGQSLFRSF
jgi:hypothetical protein